MTSSQSRPRLGHVGSNMGYNDHRITCHKTVYHDGATAIRRMRKSTIYKSAYYCPPCQGWHLSTNPPPDSPETVAEKCKGARAALDAFRKVFG